MKLINAKSRLLTAIALSILFLMGCQKQATEKGDDPQAIFPRGELGPAENFTGKAWAFGLVFLKD